ncbi:hypothetical protein FIA56_12285, partial [Testudinibacter sp. TR-2022]
SVVGDCVWFSDGVNINLESVQDTYSNRSDNKNSGWSVGGFIGTNGNSYGLAIEGSAQVGKRQCDPEKHGTEHRQPDILLTT